MLGGIQRFGAIRNEPFLDRGTVRRGEFRGSILEFAFEREKLLWHIFRAESEALAERRGRRPEGARAARNETG
jgi:hypothetical protein